MNPFLRIFGIVVVFGLVCVGWLVLGGIMSQRTSQQSQKLRGQVSELWGGEQTQKAPQFFTERETIEPKERVEYIDGRSQTKTYTVKKTHKDLLAPASTKIAADLKLDQRLKGLMWYSLYDIDFDGTWTYTNTTDAHQPLKIAFTFPDPNGLYDGFKFVVNGKDLAGSIVSKGGTLQTNVPLNPGDTVTLHIEYTSRGRNVWRYEPAEGVSNIEQFELTMNTDFADIDYPSYTMSPSQRSKSKDGWTLVWAFDRIVTGHKIGMSMPTKIQPGEMAASLSFSAPISLFFFFLILFILGTIRKIDIHPINYLFIGGAFFAFHLLFSYSVDHIHLIPAFVLSSIVSVFLVVTYLRLVISARFAFIEAALAQLVYLVGFSLAYFWEGFTGLTVTVLSIITLFLLMQMTGRIKWSEVLSRDPKTENQPSQPQPQPMTP